MISITMPKPGRAMMYTSGWPKNQKRFCHKKLLPPCSFTKNAVSAVRSMIPMNPATTKVGVARVSSAVVARMPQTKIGTRLHVMPGAR